MSEIFEFADDMAIDIPQLWTYLGDIVGIVVSGGSVTARQLKDALVVCQEFPKAATFAVRLVQTLEEEKVRLTRVFECVLGVICRDQVYSRPL